MRHLTNFFRFGCVAVLIALVGLPGAFAQTTRYVDPASTSTTASDCEDQAIGCTLATALTASAAAGDIISFRVRRDGGTVRIPEGTYTLPGNSVTFSAHLRSAGTGVRGTVEFVGDDAVVSFPSGGQVLRHANLTVKFKAIIMADGVPDPFGASVKNQGNVEVSDYIQFGSTPAMLSELVVKDDLTLRGPAATATATGPVLAVSKLTVNSGATLTVGTKGQSAEATPTAPDNPLQLRVPLVPGDKDSVNDFVVKGTIAGTGAVWIAHLATGERDAVGDLTATPPVPGFTLHHSTDYRPDLPVDKPAVDHNDCVMVGGGGRILNDVYVVAAGNVCVSLGTIGDLTVVGSLSETPRVITTDGGTVQPEYTTDIIFRTNVTIDGDLKQWNDARVVFEGKATIDGNVTLDQGVSAAGGSIGIGTTFGTAEGDAANFIRMAMATPEDATANPPVAAAPASCAYAPDDMGERGLKFSGIQFEGDARVMGDLVLSFENIADAEAAAPTDNIVCASRLIFMNASTRTVANGVEKPASRGTKVSSIDGNLDFQTAGEIILHGFSRKIESPAPNAGTYTSFHNLNLGGDLYSEAGGDEGVGEITMGSPAMSTIAGECKGNDDISLGHGNRVTFTGGGDHVVVANRDILISTLVTQGELSVEGNGSLEVTTLHVGSSGELVSSGNVQIGDNEPDAMVHGTLILQGKGLDGALHADSRITKLSYGGHSTDAAPLVDNGTLVLHAGTGEILFRDALTAGTVGLCDGTIVLADTEDEDEKTLTITGMLHVGDGTIRLDVNDPGNIGTDVSKNGSSGDRYVLRYITQGARTAGMEWFDPRDVVIDNNDAVITYEGDATIPGELDIKKGKLHVTKALTVGSAPFKLNMSRSLKVERPDDKNEGRLHAASVMTHGAVTVNGMLMTDNGDLNLSGKPRTTRAGAAISGSYSTGTAMLTIGAKGTVNLGKGDLVLGPEVTAKQDGLLGDWALNANDASVDDHATRPVASLNIMMTDKDKGMLMAGEIRVPKGSKQTMLTGGTFETVVFDGTRTPNDKGKAEDNNLNWDGTLYFFTPKVVVDSLSAMQGAVEFGAVTANNGAGDGDATAEIKRDVMLSSAKIYADHLDSLKLGGDLVVDGTGGFTSRQGAKVMIAGDFMLESDEMKGGVDVHNPVGAAYLSGGTEATVMGDFMVSGMGVAERFGSEGDTQLILKGDFHFGLVAEDQDADENYMLKANLEFSGKSQQSVETAMIDLGNVEVTNNAGVMLMSDAMQGKNATLTLTKGLIVTGSHAWIFKNTNIEENLVRRTSAQEGNRCGPGNNEACDAAIWKGSRQSYVSGMLTRHLMEGNAGGGEVTGGYLFPVGNSEGDNSFFRPVILQLPVDLSDAGAVTVSSMTAADTVVVGWPSENLLVQADGGSLTLDAHSDIFWKLELKEEISSNLSIRVAAEGLANVFDSGRLRIVQWDCDWMNPRLAGTYDLGGTSGDATFATNDFVNGVLNITQEGINVGSCSILGIASNGLENPIHLDPLTGGLTKVQFIHNLPLPAPVDLYLNDVKVRGGLGFQSATGYGYYAAGDHMISIAPVVPPGTPADTIRIPLTSLANEQNYAVIAHGAVTDPKIKILQTRLSSSVENMVEAILVHGSGDLGDVDVRVLDPANNVTPTKLLANNFSFDSATRYITLAPGAHNVQVTSPDNREEVEVYYLDLNGYQGEAVILNLSGGKDALGLMGVGKYGNVFLSQVVTGVEEEGTAEIPTEFALHGNYPNPFNPSTRIQFDLPESAQVSLQVIDMLGRQVMTLPAKEFEAGANRTLEFNAPNLASGTYLYRMIATGAESRYVKTGRMMLVK